MARARVSVAFLRSLSIDEQGRRMNEERVEAEEKAIIEHESRPMRMSSSAVMSAPPFRVCYQTSPASSRAFWERRT